MKAVRNFLVKEFNIPENQIELRYLRDSTHKGYPDLGQYEQTPVTVGVTRSGEVFNASVNSGDFFGLGGIPFHPQMAKDFNGAKSFSQLPVFLQSMMARDVSERITLLIKGHYDTNPKRNTYWSRDFFSASDRMDVPAASLGTHLKFTSLKDSISISKTVPAPIAEAKASGAGAGETKAGSAKSEAKQKKGKGKTA